MSRDEYIQSQTLEKKATNYLVQWSEPKYDCPKCKEGKMRKNMLTGRVICTLPPVYVDTYRCDKCGFEEELEF